MILIPVKSNPRCGPNLPLVLDAAVSSLQYPEERRYVSRRQLDQQGAQSVAQPQHHL